MALEDAVNNAIVGIFLTTVISVGIYSWLKNQYKEKKRIMRHYHICMAHAQK